MQEFNLEHQYQLYLQRMALSESTMHPQQKIQLRQTFFGASGQILILLSDELSKLEEEKAIETLQDLINQVGNFFLAETNKMN
jgi:phosphopantetheine adenylyltransferase